MANFKHYYWPCFLTAPNAAKPILSADNMRLDVELWPLISHKLSVEQIVIDGAVIRKHRIAKSKLTVMLLSRQVVCLHPPFTRENSWLLDIEKINISNSLVIWQTSKDEFNLRNIDLSLKKSDKNRSPLNSVEI